jgi:minor curlin subunit
MTRATLPIHAAMVAALIALGFCASGTRAQQTDGSAYTDLSGYLVGGGGDAAAQTVQAPQSEQPLGAGYNTSSVSQTGSNNETALIQQGFANTASQTQIGDNNISSLTLTGNSNNVSTLQVGNSNSFSLNLTGSNNTVSQSQVGSNLGYSISTTMSGKSITINQTGAK